MKKPSLPSDHPCPAEAAFDVIGGRWKGVILYHLLTRGTLRHGELRRLLPARATQQALTTQLRELEADGVVHREVYRQVPPKVEYSLTELGQSIRPLLLGLCDWGREYQAQAPVSAEDAAMAARGQRRRRRLPGTDFSLAVSDVPGACQIAGTAQDIWVSPRLPRCARAA